MRARKKPVEIEAHRWWKNGDHPEDNSRYIAEVSDTEPFLSEGKIVRYYRHPEFPGSSACHTCGQKMHHHGWIDNFQGGHVVCPGDYIITGAQGERYPCKPDIFEATYEIQEDSYE